MLGNWRDRNNKFGDLAKMSYDMLNIPITTVALKSAFSIRSRVLSKYKSVMLDEKFKLSYAHVIGCLVLLVNLTFIVKHFLCTITY